MAVTLVTVTALETKAQNPVDHLKQVAMLVRLLHQPADQQVDLVAALVVLVKNRGECIAAPIKSLLASLSPRIAHCGFIEGGTETIAGANHVVTPDVGSFTQFFEMAQFLFEKNA